LYEQIDAFLLTSKNRKLYQIQAKRTHRKYAKIRLSNLNKQRDVVSEIL